MEDEKIVALYWERDQQAIPVTAEKYGAYCTTISINILQSREDAEECVNDTYLQAWNAMPPHRPKLLSTFLGKITRNLSLNRYHHLAAQKRGGGESALIFEEVETMVSGTDSLEQEVNRRELLAAINEFLASQSTVQRQIFVCRYWYFDSIADIASQFGVRENNVSVTLTRLRGRLRQYLSERGFEI